MTSAEGLMDRIERLLFVPNALRSGQMAVGWESTKRFLALLVHWGRFRLDLVGPPAMPIALAGEGPAERFCLDLLLWRHTAPTEDAWPDSTAVAYGAMSRFERYQVMRVLEHSRILEPTRQIEAISAYLDNRDSRPCWPPRAWSSESRTLSEQNADNPVSAQRAMSTALIARAEEGVGALDRDIGELLDTWPSAAEGASSRNMLWSLGHVRLVDAVVVSVVRAAASRNAPELS